MREKLRALEDWLARWNRDGGARDGIVIFLLRRTAYMSLDIQMPDPQVRVLGEGDTGDESAYERWRRMIVGVRE